MIEVKNLTKKYGDRVAVDNISFEVKKGEILGFLGQNGAGKTTTMKILTCFMSASKGLAKVAGYDVFDDPMEVRRRIGYLPETPPLYPEFLVSEYLQFVAELKQIPKAQRSSKIDAVLQQCQLTEVRERLIGNLSKGYRQRVGLAQALIHDPEVLILDEPTVGLDPKQVSEARNLIKSFHNRRTVIYSTHILSEVAATCDRILIIDRGKIVAQEAINAMGTTGATAKTEIVLRHMGDKEVEAVKNVRGVKSVKAMANGTNRMIIETEPNDDVIAEVSKVVVGSGLIKMSPVQLALEEYYLNLIGAKRSSTV